MIAICSHTHPDTQKKKQKKKKKNTVQRTVELVVIFMKTESRTCFVLSSNITIFSVSPQLCTGLNVKYTDSFLVSSVGAPGEGEGTEHRMEEGR